MTAFACCSSLCYLNEAVFALILYFYHLTFHVYFSVLFIDTNTSEAKNRLTTIYKNYCADFYLFVPRTHSGAAPGFLLCCHPLQYKFLWKTDRVSTCKNTVIHCSGKLKEKQTHFPLGSSRNWVCCNPANHVPPPLPTPFSTASRDAPKRGLTIRSKFYTAHQFCTLDHPNPPPLLPPLHVQGRGPANSPVIVSTETQFMDVKFR
jgi:hypothetical protein